MSRGVLTDSGPACWEECVELAHVRDWCWADAQTQGLAWRRDCATCTKAGLGVTLVSWSCCLSNTAVNNGCTPGVLQALAGFTVNGELFGVSSCISNNGNSV